MVLTHTPAPQRPNPPTNQAWDLEANYVFVHESQAVLAEETHSQCACSQRVSSWAGTVSQCPGELSVCSARGISVPVPDARLCPLPDQGLGRAAAAAVTVEAACLPGEKGVIRERCGSLTGIGHGCQAAPGSVGY